MLLSSQFIKWPGSQTSGSHLRLRWIGPFEIEKVSKNRQSVTLKLYGAHDFHNVIPVHRVKLYYPDETDKRKHLEPPMPVMIDDEQAFEVRKFLTKLFQQKEETSRVSDQVPWLRE